MCQRAVTCPECRTLMARTADIMTQQSTIEAVVAYLQGEGLCGTIDVLDCQTYMAYVMPLALPVLAQELIGSTDDICAAIAGVC